MKRPARFGRSFLATVGGTDLGGGGGRRCALGAGPGRGQKSIDYLKVATDFENYMIRYGRESEDSWRTLLENLPGRGLRAPALVVHDGNAGLIKTLKLAWPGVAAAARIDVPVLDWYREAA